MSSMSTPIIDLILAVSDSADASAYLPPMEADGYVLRIREPDCFEHRLFKGPDTDINLHVRSSSSPEIDRMLAFRDRLRADDDERRLDETVKRELTARDWAYVQHDADAKERDRRGDRRASSPVALTRSRIRSHGRSSDADAGTVRSAVPARPPDGGACASPVVRSVPRGRCVAGGSIGLAVPNPCQIPVGRLVGGRRARSWVAGTRCAAPVSVDGTGRSARWSIRPANQSCQGYVSRPWCRR